MAGAIIFDLDGTLTVPVLDFDAIRAELGLADGPILEAIAHMDDAARARAEAVLERHERRAAYDSILQEGAADSLAALRRRGHRLAILTRNARRWAQVVLDKHGLLMDAMRCRDDGAIKPSTEPVEALCAELGCRPGESWMVGDHLFDIQSGSDAGCTTVLFVGDRPAPDYAHRADHVIRRLGELPALLEAVDKGTGHRNGK
ncbi:MAG: HAD family hydrolase [Planctomycetota bacterium]|jgi:HAD superfamily hydrolase (TIGR01549 family)